MAEQRPMLSRKSLALTAETWAAEIEQHAIPQRSRKINAMGREGLFLEPPVGLEERSFFTAFNDPIPR
jgi:hypothetical protein